MRPIQLKIALKPALLIAAAYLLLIAAVEPHRVHHSFDRQAMPSCPVYALAKGCHAQAVAPATAEHSAAFIEIIIPIRDRFMPRAEPPPAAQRAPPIA